MVVEIAEAAPEQISTVDVAQEETAQPDELQFYFASNQTDVKQADYEKLIAHAEYLIKHPDMKLKLSGHTDQSGSREYNQQLAEQRAQSVAAVLIEYGVQPAQIVTESLGEDYPTTGYEHAIYDRRVELEYSAITRLTESSF
ncbi:MAG: OmpA family protein [Gammaproteobacteria bacterium]|nr:OmpA family protein [Gammaproteobacteria bacterium]